jgi:hypothetical protein
MEEVSALFNERVLLGGVPTSEQRYRNALFHLMTSQTSCYRYWGEGLWTDYGKEICRRASDILRHDFGEQRSGLPGQRGTDQRQL